MGWVRAAGKTLEAYCLGIGGGGGGECTGEVSRARE